MNWRPSAPRVSGLVCSGDRLVITSSERRASPEAAEEEPERAEPHAATGEAQESAWRRWRRRMFGS
jgi:hypothetical protein